MNRLETYLFKKEIDNRIKYIYGEVNDISGEIGQIKDKLNQLKTKAQQGKDTNKQKEKLSLLSEDGSNKPNEKRKTNGDSTLKRVRLNEEEQTAAKEDRKKFQE